MTRNLLISTALIVLVVVFFMVLPVPRPVGNSFVVRDVRLFDGEDVIERTDVLVIDGLIAAVGDDLVNGVSVPAGTVEFPGEGHTLLPAFIDSHTHNFLSSRTEALRFGVGTQIDMFSAVEMLPQVKQQRESLASTEEADMWSAGTLVTVSGGHGTQFGLQIPVLDNADGAAQFIAERVAEGSDFIKLVLEDGYMEGQKAATLDTATLSAAITAAHAHERKALVHVSSLQDAQTAVAEGADGLVHLFGDVVADAAFLTLAKERAFFVVPTLTVLESISARAHGLADDARLRPWLASSQLDSLNQQFPPSSGSGVVIDNALTSTRLLYEAGVPILAGTDAGNPGTAHGASIHREMELLVQAGLPVAAALAAATSVPARHFGLTDRGNVVAGLRADLVLVAGNPLEDITHTRNIKAIWKNGYQVERQTFDAAESSAQSSAQPPAPALTQPELGNFATSNDAWTPSSDRFQGGQSTATLSVSDGVLVVDATLAPGTFWPWAGATRMLGQPPMSPVDASAFTYLDLRLKGTGTVYLTVFSGSLQGIPAQWPMQLDGQWQDLSVELRKIPGVDVERLAAIAIIAGQVPGTSRIEIDSVVLR